MNIIFYYHKIKINRLHHQISISSTKIRSAAQEIAPPPPRPSAAAARRSAAQPPSSASSRRPPPPPKLISFVSEHIETLEEIDMEYRELALESGIENWGRVPALGCKSSFITDLADAVIESLPSASVMSTAKSASQDGNTDLVQYAVNLFFGSIFAFVLLLSPRLISGIRNFL